jgi:hypothetical protein
VAAPGLSAPPSRGELRDETREPFDRLAARIDGKCGRIDAACEPPRRE